MSNSREKRHSALKFFRIGLRIGLGLLFIYFGWQKASQPVEFLKAVRFYEVIENSLLLNLIAGILPWFEIFLGLLFIGGIWVRGAAAIACGMLLAFSAAVAFRAMQIQELQNLAFCSVRFDCGCGGGEVVICHKLIENAVLLLAGLIVLKGATGQRIASDFRPVQGSSPKY